MQHISGVRRTQCALLLLLALGISACGIYRESPNPPGITDPSYLTHERWNDGRAEVAFYRVERTYDHYGRDRRQTFLVGTYLVKHTFDWEAMSKAGEDPGRPVSSFKYALFFELDSGSYQHKRSYVVNARQRDLRPLKHSFTSFDWCSNHYREFAFSPGGTVGWLERSDDYGNGRTHFEYRPSAYTAAQVPVLVRGLDFSGRDTLAFEVVHDRDTYTRAEAYLRGVDSVSTPGGSFEAEKITVRYDSPIPSPVAETTDRRETYWRTTDPERHLVQLEGHSGDYAMRLVEVTRSAYWKQNVYDEFDHIKERP